MRATLLKRLRIYIEREREKYDGELESEQEIPTWESERRREETDSESASERANPSRNVRASERSQ